MYNLCPWRTLCGGHPIFHAFQRHCSRNHSTWMPYWLVGVFSDCWPPSFWTLVPHQILASHLLFWNESHLFWFEVMSISIARETNTKSSDNSTVVSYINEMGGSHSSTLYSLSIIIWKLAFRLNADLIAVLLLWVCNTIADSYSWSSPSNNEYSISIQTFNTLVNILNVNPEVDLFASCLKSKLGPYVSRHIDPFAWNTVVSR